MNNAAFHERSAHSWPPPSANPDLIGHQKAEQDLLQAAMSHRLPHAWLFCGAEGIGKATLAYRFARFLLAGKAASREDEGPGLFGDPPPSTQADTLFIEQTHPVFQRIAAGGHNDLLVIESGTNEKKKTDIIDVETVRKIEPFLRLTAGQEGWRVVIIDGADMMNRSAQNAVLKILEEPGERSILILIAENPGVLLPTIRSRCRMLRLESESSALDSLFPELPQDDRAILRFMAQDSLGNAIRLIQEDALKHYHDALDFLNSVANPVFLHKMADLYAKASAESWIWFQKSLLLIIHAAARGRALPGGDIGNLPLNKLSQSALIRLYDQANASFSRTESLHLDKKQTLFSLADLVLQAR